MAYLAMRWSQSEMNAEMRNETSEQEGNAPKAAALVNEGTRSSSGARMEHHCTTLGTYLDISDRGVWSTCCQIFDLLWFSSSVPRSWGQGGAASSQGSDSAARKFLPLRAENTAA